MPYCLAFECNSHSGRKTEENVSFHSFPKGTENLGVARVWYARCGTDLGVSVDKFNPEQFNKSKMFLCSKHFLDSDFATQTAEKMGFRVRRLLKAGTTPTIFHWQATAGRSGNSTRKSSDNRAKQKEKQELLSSLLGDEQTRITSASDTGASCTFKTLQQSQDQITYEIISEHEDSDINLAEPISRDQGVQTDTWTANNVNIHLPNVRDQYVQTDSKQCDAFVQWPEFEHNFIGEQTKIDHDHCYSMLQPDGMEVDNPVTFEPLTTSTPLKMRTNDTDMEQLHEHMDETFLDEADSSNDPDFTLAGVSLISEESMIIEDDTHSWEEKKYIIFDAQLQELFRMVSCPICMSKVDSEDVTTSQRGSFLTAKFTCLNSHSFEWQSQPLYGRQPTGNIFVCASTLFTGSTFESVSSFSDCMNLQIPGKTTFYDMQSQYLFSVIADVWDKEQQRQIAKLKQVSEVVLVGDARMDSPGWNAKYCVYSLMSKATGEIVHFNVLQVTETEKATSQSMEKEGCKRALDFMADHDIKVHTFGTDRHVGVQAMLKLPPYSERVTFHEFDPWHIVKGVVGKIRDLSKKKAYRVLALWSRSIGNHLWWCMASSPGNPSLLQEKWLSILYHIVDIHEWDSPDMTTFTKCAHGPLDTESRIKPWLVAGSVPHEGLKTILRNKNLLPALNKTSRMCHTGKLEVYHSMLLKYTPKREHFSHDGMVARTMLAALDNNANVGRKQAVITHESGVSGVLGELRYNIVHPKAKGDWVARPLYEPKSYAWHGELWSSLSQVLSGTKACVQSYKVPNLPRNIAKTEKPDKSDVVAKHQSRYK